MLGSSISEQGLIAEVCATVPAPPDDTDDPGDPADAEVTATGADAAGPVAELDPHAAIDIAMATRIALRTASSQSSRRPTVASRESGPVIARS
ncbi:MAG: hypothetical protein ACHQNA_08705 [Acidimicrobiales bacterium]